MVKLEHAGRIPENEKSAGKAALSREGIAKAG
jgi:hypothetical protein